MLLMAGCDYNEKHFDGFDDINIEDLVQYEGEYDGDYPEAGYFTDKATLESSVNAMLKKMYLYIDKGSAAKVHALYGDITPGFAQADAAYTLTDDDYIAMGTESGQPGKYKNFDGNMDVDHYLTAFCDTKYGSLAVGKVVSITYKFYAAGAGTSTLTNSYQKSAAGWDAVELDAFAADHSYTLVTEDYDSMGTESGKPGKYDNFDSNMDVDHYLTVLLKMKFPYMEANKTCQVSYQFYSGGASERSTFYKYDGNVWHYFNPYADVVEVSTKVAEMVFDGTNWNLARLLGGSVSRKIGNEEYTLLVDWVKANKAEFVSTTNDKEEFYFGASSAYFNINNNYNTWRSYYNVGGIYTDKSNDEIQEIMDARMEEGISKLILPSWYAKPDPGLSYIVVYNVYQGRGSGDYAMSFMYDEEKGEYERTGGPIKQ